MLRRARKELEALPRQVQQSIARKIEALASDPYPRDSRELAGELEGLRRIRVGDYRVLYGVDDGVLIIEVVRVAHRREVYR